MWPNMQRKLKKKMSVVQIVNYLFHYERFNIWQQNSTRSETEKLKNSVYELHGHFKIISGSLMMTRNI